jgi:hypothetical protein
MKLAIHAASCFEPMLERSGAFDEARVFEMPCPLMLWQTLHLLAVNTSLPLTPVCPLLGGGGGGVVGWVDGVVAPDVVAEELVPEGLLPEELVPDELVDGVVEDLVVEELVDVVVLDVDGVVAPGVAALPVVPVVVEPVVALVPAVSPMAGAVVSVGIGAVVVPIVSAGVVALVESAFSSTFTSPEQPKRRRARSAALIIVGRIVVESNRGTIVEVTLRSPRIGSDAGERCEYASPARQWQRDLPIVLLDSHGSLRIFFPLAVRCARRHCERRSPTPESAATLRSPGRVVTLSL